MRSPRIGSLFSGYGGLDLAVLDVLGGTVAWHADNDPGAARILAHRWPDAPNLGNITKVDWQAVEPVDVLTGGFPCQDVSHAGKRAGLGGDGARSGLWVEMAAAIAALRPSLVIIENVLGLLSARAERSPDASPLNLGPRHGNVGDDGDRPVLRAMGAVLGDLADLGYDAEWTTVRASDVGAPHRRARVFITAWPANPSVAGREGSQRSDEEGWRRSARPSSQDPDVATRSERWQSAPGQEEGGRARTDPCRRGGAPTPDTDDAGRGRVEEPHREPQRGRPAGEHRGHPDGLGLATHRPLDWAGYAPAIRRWEAVLGRSAPLPTEPGRTGPRLNPRFVEWMMGLPDGWITDVPGLTRNHHLKALGNGVVPQQAAHALRALLTPGQDY